MNNYVFKNLDADFGNDLASAISSIGSTPTTLVIPIPTNAITVNLVIPETLTLMFTNSGRLVVGASYTVTLHSPKNIVAPTRMVIFPSGGELGTVQFSYGGEVHFGWWGKTYVLLQSAIDSLEGAINGGVVLLPHGKIEKPDAVGEFLTIYMKSHVHLRGVGEGSLLAGSTSDTLQPAPTLSIHGVEDVVIERVYFFGVELNRGMVEIDSSSEHVPSKCITIRDCIFHSGDYGIRVNNVNGQEHPVSDINIFSNNIISIDHCIDIGHNSLGEDHFVHNVKIVGNTIEARSGSGGHDCIKSRKNVADILIKDNILRGDNTNTFSGDGIDLFASGYRVIIVGNVIEGNGVQGIDIKTDNDSHPPGLFTENREVVIKNNIIRNNRENGIKIANEATDPNEWVELIDVSNNEISGNRRWGIKCAGRQINIRGNLIYGNAYDEDVLYTGGIRLEGNQDTGEISKFIVVSDNIIANNGHGGTTDFGIQITSLVADTQILRNCLSNDLSIPYPGGLFPSVGIALSDDTSGILFKDNRMINFSPGGVGDLAGVDGNHTLGVDGEVVTCHIGDTIATSGSDELIPLFVAPTDLFLLSAVFVNAENIQPSLPHSEAYLVERYEGTSSTKTFRLDFPALEIESMKSYTMQRQMKPTTPPSPELTTLEKGQVLMFRKQANGYPLTNAKVILRYVAF